MTEAQDRARATWSAGDFDAIAQRIWEVGDTLVEKVGVTEGERVLDVATGTGNAAIPAAVKGGVTTGLDITPELLEDARGNAAAAGVEVEWVEGDAQDLPFEDASFDVVLSTFGCMFAPDHRKTAGEIARVLAPGGRFGVVAWRPEGNIGKFFLTIAKYAPPPPEGFQPPPLWGVRDHVNRDLRRHRRRPAIRGRRRALALRLLRGDGRGVLDQVRADRHAAAGARGGRALG